MSDYKGVHKDVARLLKLAHKAGCEIHQEKSSGHIKVVDIHGEIAQVSKHPGSGAALRGFRSRLRKMGVAC